MADSLLSNITTGALPAIDYGHWFLQTVAMGVTCFLIRGLKITHPLGAVATVVVLAFVNATVWSAALFFKIPDTLSSQALTLALANGAIFWGLVKLLPGIEVRGVVPALIAPLVFSALSIVCDKFDDKIPWKDLGTFIVSSVEEIREELLSDVPKE